jgi:CheY-like chemotaxis protein
MSRRVVAVVPDLMFQVRMRETARMADVELEIISARDVAAACRDRRPDLVVLDLTDPADPFAAAAALRREPGLGDVPIIGFYPHVDASLRERALVAGIQPLPRSAFTARLAAILAGTTG